MPKRIEHVSENGQESKWCYKCKTFKPLSQFTVNNRTWDGLEQLCTDCNTSRSKNARWCALNVYRNLLKRIATHPNYLAKGVECRMARDEFVEWYLPRHFHGCLLDRIDNQGHYEIGNIQLINRTQHNYKLRADNLEALGIIEPAGQRYCYKCGTLKHIDEFGTKAKKVTPVNPLGLNDTCKECCREARKQLYRNRRT